MIKEWIRESSSFLICYTCSGVIRENRMGEDMEKVELSIRYDSTMDCVKASTYIPQSCEFTCLGIPFRASGLLIDFDSPGFIKFPAFAAS